MTLIPFKRLGNRTSIPIRSWANARNAMAFASILLIILLYVIWTSTGNSSSSTSSTSLMLSLSSSSSTGSNSGVNKFYKNYVRAPSSSNSENKLNNNNMDAHDDSIIQNNAAAVAAVAFAPILLAAKIAGAENFIVADDHKNSKKFNVIFDKEENSRSENEHILYGNNFDGGGGGGDAGKILDLLDDNGIKNGINSLYDKKNAFNKNSLYNHHQISRKHEINKITNHIHGDNILIKNKNSLNTINLSNKLPKSGKTNSQLKVEQSIAAAAAARASKPAVNIYNKKSVPQTSDKKRNIIKTVQDAGIVNDSMNICNENFDDNRQYIQNRPRNEYDNLPIIYFVTPTYPRREQIPELTRLGQTLMHVPRIHWIVADDFLKCNSNLDFLLNTFGVPYTHIASPMPDIYRAKSPNPRGVANRRAALNWIRTGHHKQGVLYFGDDDNTFDLKLFSEIRDTKKVSMFPVGLIGLYAVSSPVVKAGKVIGFFDSWPAKRRWPVDMAGFAVNLQYLSQHPNATMPYRAGYEEDAFLRSISLRIEDIEPKASNCTEILVWHTQTQKSKAPTVHIESKYIYNGSSSLAGLFRELEALNVSHHSDSTGVKAQISRDGKARPISYFFR